MKFRKAIAYAYPTSETAIRLGVRAQGGFYVQQFLRLENGEWSPAYIAPGTGGEAFDRADDPDLIALYKETDGEPDPYFLQHGPEAALFAIQARG